MNGNVIIFFCLNNGFIVIEFLIVFILFIFILLFSVEIMCLFYIFFNFDLVFLEVIKIVKNRNIIDNRDYNIILC